MARVFRKNLYTGEEEWVDVDWETPQRIEHHGPEHGRYFGSNKWSTGLESHGMSVHPEQAKEYNEQAKKEGFTGVHFKPDGTAVFESRLQRKRYCEQQGHFDRRAGYGDPQPRRKHS